MSRTSQKLTFHNNYLYSFDGFSKTRINWTMANWSDTFRKNQKYTHFFHIDDSAFLLCSIFRL